MPLHPGKGEAGNAPCALLHLHWPCVPGESQALREETSAPVGREHCLSSEGIKERRTRKLTNGLVKHSFIVRHT